MIINCCIIEDEEPAIELLTFFIKENKQLKLTHSSFNNINLPKEVLDGNTLLFLDIQMPFRTGLDFLKEQQSEKKLPVILTTSYAHHALEAYNLWVIDYLLKPFSKKRFNESIEKAQKYFNVNTNQIEEKFIWVNDDYKKVKIFAKDILYIESDKQYVKIYTKEKRFIIIQTLKSLEDEFANSGFIRCHKSFLINKIYISKYNQSSVFVNNFEIPIGKLYLEGVMKVMI